MAQKTLSELLDQANQLLNDFIRRRVTWKENQELIIDIIDSKQQKLSGTGYVYSTAGNISHLNGDATQYLRGNGTLGLFSAQALIEEGANIQFTGTGVPGDPIVISSSAGTIPSFPAGSVIFSNGTTIAADNPNFFYDDTNNRLGLGTTTPSAIIHSLGTAEQLRVGYNATNYMSINISATGTAVFSSTGTGGQGFVFTSVIYADQGLTTSTTRANAVFNIGSALGTNSTSSADLMVDGSSTVFYRISERGSQTGTPTAGTAYASHIIGTQAATIAATGTHNLFTNFAIRPLFIGNAGGTGTLTNSATLYIEGASIGAANNYSIWAKAGAVRFGHLAGTGLEMVTVDENGVLGRAPIPSGGGGGGSVTGVAVANTNGFNGTSNNNTITPTLTLSTTVTGLIKGVSGALTQAIAGTDYQAPLSGTGVVKSTEGTISYINGSSSQYIKGDGTLETIPTIDLEGAAYVYSATITASGASFTVTHGLKDAHSITIKDLTDGVIIYPEVSPSNEIDTVTFTTSKTGRQYLVTCIGEKYVSNGNSAGFIYTFPFQLG